MKIEIIGQNEEQTVADVKLILDGDDLQEYLIRFSTPDYTPAEGEEVGYLLIGVDRITFELITQILNTIPFAQLIDFIVPQTEV